MSPSSTSAATPVGLTPHSPHSARPSPRLCADRRPYSRAHASKHLHHVANQVVGHLTLVQDHRSSATCGPVPPHQLGVVPRQPITMCHHHHHHHHRLHRRGASNRRSLDRRPVTPEATCGSIQTTGSCAAAAQGEPTAVGPGRPAGRSRTRAYSPTPHQAVARCRAGPGSCSKCLQRRDREPAVPEPPPGRLVLDALPRCPVLQPHVHIRARCGCPRPPDGGQERRQPDLDDQRRREGRVVETWSPSPPRGRSA
jgi:hypothetical protein